MMIPREAFGKMDFFCNFVGGKVKVSLFPRANYSRCCILIKYDRHKTQIIMTDKNIDLVRKAKDAKNIRRDVCRIWTDRQVEGWDAQDWLNRFEIAKRNHNTHSVRAEVFQSTLRLSEAGTYVSENRKLVGLSNYLNPDAVSDNVFYDREIHLLAQDKQYDTQYKVVERDCLDYAHELLQADPTDDLAILNMASASNPGGGVYGGAGAQEEYLFRCSDYYRFLFQYAINFDCRSYGITPNAQHRYPLDRNFGGVYTYPTGGREGEQRKQDGINVNKTKPL